MQNGALNAFNLQSCLGGIKHLFSSWKKLKKLRCPFFTHSMERSYCILNSRLLALKILVSCLNFLHI